MKKYNRTFSFFETEKQAKDFCEGYNKSASPYIRKNKPARYTPWRSNDGTENMFVAHYYV